MFMNRNARCGGCEKLFCCSKHRKEHQPGCEPFRSKLMMMYLEKVKITNQTSRAREQINSPLIKNTKKEDASDRKTKRKHDHSGSPFPPSTTFLVPIDRKFKKAVRGKFRKVQKVPTLEPLMEEDEGVEQGFRVPSVTVTIPSNDLSKTKPTTLDAYNDFKVGSLKDSPITTVAPVPLKKIKGILVTPTSSREADKLDDIFKTSTPDNGSLSVNNIADQPGKTPVPKLAVRFYTPHLAANLTASTPKESELKNDPDGAGITTKVQPVLCTPVDSQVPTRQRFIRSISSSGSSGSSLYYSACSIISPLALNSHPPTPVSNPSLFTSVKDVFRTFISRLPGTAVSDARADGAVSSPMINSPARKRMKKLAESRIQCRPTYKGRYKKPSSYAFNS